MSCQAATLPRLWTGISQEDKHNIRNWPNREQTAFRQSRLPQPVLIRSHDETSLNSPDKNYPKTGQKTPGMTSVMAMQSSVYIAFNATKKS